MRPLNTNQNHDIEHHGSGMVEVVPKPSTLTVISRSHLRDIIICVLLW